MVDNRLRRLFKARTQTQGDDLFGDYELVNPSQPLDLAPVKRVAVLTESFLPKVDGVSKTSSLTIRYLQETGREVLVFGPDISVPSVGSSEVVPFAKSGGMADVCGTLPREIARARSAGIQRFPGAYR